MFVCWLIEAWIFYHARQCGVVRFGDFVMGFTRSLMGLHVRSS
jgi:hypothetical protein